MKISLTLSILPWSFEEFDPSSLNKSRNRDHAFNRFLNPRNQNFSQEEQMLLIPGLIVMKSRLPYEG